MQPIRWQRCSACYKTVVSSHPRRRNGCQAARWYGYRVAELPGQRASWVQADTALPTRFVSPRCSSAQWPRTSTRPEDSMRLKSGALLRPALRGLQHRSTWLLRLAVSSCSLSFFLPFSLSFIRSTLHGPAGRSAIGTLCAPVNSCRVVISRKP